MELGNLALSPANDKAVEFSMLQGLRCAGRNADYGLDGVELEKAVVWQRANVGYELGRRGEYVLQL